MKRRIWTLCICLFLAGCSTLSQGQTKQKALKLLTLLEEGKTTEAIAMTGRPFLFEGEILVSEGLVSDLWLGLAGLDLSDVELSRVAVVDGDSYRYFRDSWEAATWFQNYTDENSLLVFYDWKDKEIVLVVDRVRENPERILGFGEVRR